MNDSEYTSRVSGMERRMYRIAYSILWNDADCADAISEAVFRGWMKKGVLKHPEYFETWLIRILINCSRDILRRRRRTADVNAAAPENASLPEDTALRDALRQLPEKYRVPLLLHHLEGYGLDEISDMIGIPQTTVKSRLYQARMALRALIEKEGGSI